jgi:hypothetical protein
VSVLDDLARSLASPMPRSRALRLLGGALVSAATAGVLGRAPAPARASRLAGTCTGPSSGVLAYEFFCAPHSNAGPECGPPRGGVPDCCDARGPKCCSDGPPDNGRTGHYCCEAGCDCYKGLCCPPGGDRGVDKQGKPLCCPRGWKLQNGGCVPKVCGPDISEALEAALERTKSAFGGWSTTTRYDVCIGLVTLPAAAVSWDIAELGPGGREKLTREYPACASCGNSVRVGRDCHYSGSVNYVAYGVMMRLCHDYLSHEDSSIADWFTPEEMLELIYMHKNQSGTQAANFQASNEWALTGYHTKSIRPTPEGDRKECQERCSDSYSGPGFTVRWLPKIIRP